MLPVRIHPECMGLMGLHLSSAHFLLEREPLRERDIDSLFRLNLLPSPSNAIIFAEANPRKAPPECSVSGAKACPPWRSEKRTAPSFTASPTKVAPHKSAGNQK